MSYINDIVGTPYKELDCYALVRKVSLDFFGVQLPSVDDYSEDPARIVRECLAGLGWVELAGFVPGAVAVLGTTPFDSRHVGICLEDGQILHTCRKYGAIIQSTAQLSRTGYLFQRYYQWRGES